MIDAATPKDRIANREFDSREFVLAAENLVHIAMTCGETLPKYTDPNHDDFQALPAAIAAIGSASHLHLDFPSLGGIPNDGGKSVRILRPTGRRLVARTYARIRQKRGRQVTRHRCEVHRCDIQRSDRTMERTTGVINAV
jgi:hypothetical protein